MGDALNSPRTVNLPTSAILKSAILKSASTSNHQRSKPSKVPPIPRQPFSRINFLYQASLLMMLPPSAARSASMPVPPSAGTSTLAAVTYPTPTVNPSPEDPEMRKSEAMVWGTPAVLPLSRFYLSTARSIARKSVLRMAPSLKRSICKRCETHLVAGVSSEG
ncbi:hypothetical protein BDZ91DRAFT_80901 [Kalaharituber pfeilii]|nr:hypothetical protein BDZ91DRAFT_80901 [Kalaharituber pfeilii]